MEASEHGGDGGDGGDSGHSGHSDSDGGVGGVSVTAVGCASYCAAGGGGCAVELRRQQPSIVKAGDGCRPSTLCTRGQGSAVVRDASDELMLQTRVIFADTLIFNSRFVHISSILFVHYEYHTPHARRYELRGKGAHAGANRHR